MTTNGKREHFLIATADEFVEHLTGTLIPDLRKSGYETTADDFENALLWMRWLDVNRG